MPYDHANCEKMDISPQGAPDHHIPPRDIDWVNLIFMLIVHVVAVAGSIWYLSEHELAAHHLIIWGSGFVLTTLAISAGYHRLFAHRNYQTGRALKGIWLFFGAAAFQTSVFQWARTHRAHHHHIDTPNDPYDATRGLWYSHMGWILQKAPPRVVDDEDLRLDPLVRFQDKHYVLIGALSGFVLPGIIGFAWGDLWGGLLFGGVLRLVSVYHATFSINSLAHWVGSQPYSKDTTARDSWLTAVVTMGEGYHNFHHTFPGDYRNGFRTFDFDPPKWLLMALESLGVVRNLRRTPEHLVALRRLRTDKQRMDATPLSDVQREELERRTSVLKLALGGWARANDQGERSGRPNAKIQRRNYLTAYDAWRLHFSRLEASDKGFELRKPTPQRTPMLRPPEPAAPHAQV